MCNEQKTASVVCEYVTKSLTAVVLYCHGWKPSVADISHNNKSLLTTGTHQALVEKCWRQINSNESVLTVDDDDWKGEGRLVVIRRGHNVYMHIYIYIRVSISMTSITHAIVCPFALLPFVQRKYKFVFNASQKSEISIQQLTRAHLSIRCHTHL